MAYFKKKIGIDRFTKRRFSGIKICPGSCFVCEEKFEINETYYPSNNGLAICQKCYEEYKEKGGRLADLSRNVNPYK